MTWYLHNVNKEKSNLKFGKTKGSTKIINNVQLNQVVASYNLGILELAKYCLLPPSIKLQIRQIVMWKKFIKQHCDVQGDVTCTVSS